jgi:hypothetical protein
MPLTVHVVIPDLFLPHAVMDAVCRDLKLPALERMLARARVEPLPVATLEAWLCEAFRVKGGAIAPVALEADGLKAGDAYWLCATPVTLHLRRDQLVLQPDIPVAQEEADALCASLNAHFAADGLHFFAPRPERWYLRLDRQPGMSAVPLAQVAGRNIHDFLPQGEKALYWHGVLNEIQMLLFNHPVNAARDARGDFAINSVWLWGGGVAGEASSAYANVFGDSGLAAAFAQAAGVPWGGEQDMETSEGDALVVFENLRSAVQAGDFARFRDEVLKIEAHCAHWLAALKRGRMDSITLDVPGENSPRRFVLTRGRARKFWLRPKSLIRYALV